MRVYIAGPMTGYPECNFPAFHAEAARLRALGYDVVSPAELNPDHESVTRATCLRRDTFALLSCDMVALLPGSMDSKGVKYELTVARECGIDVQRAALLQERVPPAGSLGGDSGDVGLRLAINLLVAERMRTTQLRAELTEARGALAEAETTAGNMATLAEARRGQLAEAHAQIDHLLNDLSVAEVHDGLTFYSVRRSMLTSNLIAALKRMRGQAQPVEPERCERPEPCAKPGCNAHWGITCGDGHMRLKDCQHWSAATQPAAQPLMPAAPLCGCKAREAAACPGAWEPGCDLGNNAAHARPADPQPQQSAEPLTVTLTDGKPVTPDHRDIDPATGLQKGYVVLSASERAKGYVRPVRHAYTHATCKTNTVMGQALAETYARDPKFYSGTFCVACRDHFPLDQFVWAGTKEQVGS